MGLIAVKPGKMEVELWSVRLKNRLEPVSVLQQAV
jgi:hypothetical protein